MTRRPSMVPSFASLALLALACSGPAQPANIAATPASTAEKPKVATAQPAPSASASAVPAEIEAPKEVTKEEEPAPAAMPEPIVHALDVLTGRETAFLIDYANSGAKEHAEKACASATASNVKPEDEAEHRKNVDACMQKERAKFTADVLRFRKDDKGRGTLTIYRRIGSSLPEMYVAKVEYKEGEHHSVKVIVKAGMSGVRPICRDKQDLDVTVPNGYSIELQDSVYGKLTYEAKIGLVAN